MSSDPISKRSAATLHRLAVGLIAAAVIALVLNALLTVAKDYFQPLHDLMVKLIEHHWITYGVS
ncbi:MAG: hypothetical protein J2P54_23240, partial [Bradyrhizobiaceae bacterium]|nr:hypothetical protein [Bradyrhizobiaceae bacterium]